LRFMARSRSGVSVGRSGMGAYAPHGWLVVVVIHVPATAPAGDCGVGCVRLAVAVDVR
jgi:hypothetical protein